MASVTGRVGSETSDFVAQIFGDDVAAVVRALVDFVADAPQDDAWMIAVAQDRWIVERTFGWLMLQRRLVRD